MSKKSDRREKLVKFSNIAAVYALLSFEHELFVIVKNAHWQSGSSKKRVKINLRKQTSVISL